jgi:hypothetical protein
MPASTGSHTPTGIELQMSGAVLAPVSHSGTLKSANTQFNGMTCTEYTHKYTESPPTFFYYDCVGFTGYAVREGDPVAWNSVRTVLNIGGEDIVPTPYQFEGHGPDDTRKPNNPLSQRNAPITTAQGLVQASGLGIGTIALDTTTSGIVTSVEWNVGDHPEGIQFGAARPLS